MRVEVREPAGAGDGELAAAAQIESATSVTMRFVLLRLWLERHQRLTLVRKSAGG